MPADVLTPAFRQAAQDYRYLIERGYSQKSSLKITGDRYALTACQRTMLYRGVLPRGESENRRKGLTAADQGGGLTIDGYNIIVTVANYLYGRPVFLGTDGLLRDAGDAYGRMVRGPVFDTAMELVLTFLEKTDRRPVQFLLDRPVPKSGELAARLREELSRRSVEGSAETVRSPDYELKQMTAGAVCTSDSAVIDACRVPVCDLAREVLDDRFAPEYIDLNSLFPSA